MLNLLGIVFPLVIALTMSNNSHAMKRTLNGEATEATTFQKIKINIVSASKLPPDIIETILANLTLHDLSLSFVNWLWYKKVQKVFEDFYQFQKTYHECKINYGKDKLCRNSLEVLRKLREADLHLIENGRSKTERKAIAEAFFVRNLDLINETLTKPSSELEEWCCKNPERLMQLALMRIWDYEKFIALALGYDDSLFKYYDNFSLKPLAPSHILASYFTIETDFTCKCELALELCQRGFSQAKVIVDEAFNKYYLTNRWDSAVDLFEIALNSDHDWLPEYYLYAAFSNYTLGRWQRAAELYEIALQKDPNLATLNYLNAAYSNLQLGNRQKAISFCRVAREKDPACLHGLFRIDTLFDSHT